MHAEWQVAVAAAGDWHAVRTLLGNADLPTADLSESNLRQFTVARVAENVVGAVALQPDGKVGLLRSLVVAPEQRGQGIGARLVAAVEQRAGVLGLREIWLLTIDAGPFFAAQGYALTGREQVPASIAASAEFRELCPASAELYRKRLAGTR